MDTCLVRWVNGISILCLYVRYLFLLDDDDDGHSFKFPVFSSVSLVLFALSLIFIICILYALDNIGCPTWKRLKNFRKQFEHVCNIHYETGIYLKGTAIINTYYRKAKEGLCSLMRSFKPTNERKGERKKKNGNKKKINIDC